MSSNNINDSSTLTVRFTGQFSFKKNNKKKRTLILTGIIANPILEDDLITGSLNGIDISGKTFFNNKQDESYGIFCFTKKDLKFPNQEVFENLLSEKDITTLRSLKKNKDFFSFDATIDLSNFDNKLHKINNVQKIEDKEQIKKIKKLMKQARNNKQAEKRI